MIIKNSPKISILSYRDLEAYKSAHKLALFIYKITTNFPAEEKCGLQSQMRRAAVSIGSNIAEGFARNGAKDKIQFYTISRGSLFELESQCLIARDLSFLSSENYFSVCEKITFVSKLLSGLIKSAMAKPDPKILNTVY